MNEMLLKMLVNMIGPETVAGMKALVPLLQAWDERFALMATMQADTLATVTRIELMMAGSVVTPELHAVAADMARDDPRNAGGGYISDFEPTWQEIRLAQGSAPWTKEIT